MEMNELKLIDSTSVSPSELVRIDLPALQISFLEENFDERSALLVIQHARVVHQSENAIRSNARQLCISLFLCHEAYVIGSPAKSALGWGPFCVANFSSIGLSDGNIRAAVRTGESLIRHEKNYPEGIEQFDRLSRAALLALGGNEETLVAVQQVLADNPDKGLTAKSIRQIQDELKEEKLLRLQTEIRLKTIEETNAELALSITERREQAARWREKAEKAEKEARTPVEALVYQLPPGVRSEDELRTTLQTENTALLKNKERLLSDVNTSTEELIKIQKGLVTFKHVSNMLEMLEADVHLIRSKFPAVLVEKLMVNSPESKDRLRVIAFELRAIAAAIDVQ